MILKNNQEKKNVRTYYRDQYRDMRRISPNREKVSKIFTYLEVGNVHKSNNISQNNIINK